MIKKLTLLSLVLILSLSVNLWAQDSPRWSISPMTTIYPNGQYVDLPQVTYENPNKTPKTVVTPIGTFVVAPNIRVYPSSTQQTETPIVRHPTNQNIMLGSSNATFGFFISEGVYVTTNGGTAWFGSDTLNANGNIAQQRGDPGPTITTNGTFIMTHLRSNTVFGGVTGISAAFSTNNGLTWSTDVQFSFSSGDDKNLAASNEVAGPNFGNAYCVWCRFFGGNNAHIWFSRTTDNGTSWISPVQVNVSQAGHFSQGADMGRVAPNGNLYVTWTAGVQGAPFTEDFLGFAVSTNNGDTWTPTENAYDVNGTRSFSFNGWGIRTNGFPRIDVDRSGGPRNGWIYIVTDEFNLSPAGSDADVILHRSTNGGTTWSAGIRVNQD
ncbi:MAG: sialidase family protein, partial [Ignavibacteria bacterium]